MGCNLLVALSIDCRVIIVVLLVAIVSIDEFAQLVRWWVIALLSQSKQSGSRRRISYNITTAHRVLHPQITDQLPYRIFF